MSLLTINTLNGSGGGEFEIDHLLGEFHTNVEAACVEPERYDAMLAEIKKFNPDFTPFCIETWSKKAQVLGQVVAGVYAPLIHGFSVSVLKNIAAGNLPADVIVPPRDSIPVAVSLHSLSKELKVYVNILTPHINRNTAGVPNNQKSCGAQKDPLLSAYFDQEKAKMNGNLRLAEAETGIYGTTSLAMAGAFKARGIKTYAPVKLYGLGPNLSFVHALLSGGETWVAEEAGVDLSTIETFMVILDSMEELGMQNAYKSVEKLRVGESGQIEPVIEFNTPEEVEIARVTNTAVSATASTYLGAGHIKMLSLISNVGQIVEASKTGLPLTLTSAIPPMDSKDTHFAKIRESRLFDYPKLIT